MFVCPSPALVHVPLMLMCLNGTNVRQNPPAWIHTKHLYCAWLCSAVCQTSTDSLHHLACNLTEGDSGGGGGEEGEREEQEEVQMFITEQRRNGELTCLMKGCRTYSHNDPHPPSPSSHLFSKSSGYYVPLPNVSQKTLQFISLFPLSDTSRHLIVSVSAR